MPKERREEPTDPPPAHSCSACGYDMSGVPPRDDATTCPECGKSRPTNTPTTRTVSTKTLWAALAVPLGCLILGTAAVLLAIFLFLYLSWGLSKP